MNVPNLKPFNGASDCVLGCHNHFGSEKGRVTSFWSRHPLLVAKHDTNFRSQHPLWTQSSFWVATTFVTTTMTQYARWTSVPWILYKYLKIGGVIIWILWVIF